MLLLMLGAAAVVCRPPHRLHSGFFSKIFEYFRHGGFYVVGFALLPESFRTFIFHFPPPCLPTVCLSAITGERHIHAGAQLVTVAGEIAYCCTKNEGTRVSQQCALDALASTSFRKQDTISPAPEICEKRQTLRTHSETRRGEVTPHLCLQPLY